MARQRIDVGGAHVEAVVEGAGPVTVVFENGLATALESLGLRGSRAGGARPDRPVRPAPGHARRRSVRRLVRPAPVPRAHGAAGRRPRAVANRPANHAVRRRLHSRATRSSAARSTPSCTRSSRSGSGSQGRLEPVMVARGRSSSPARDLRHHRPHRIAAAGALHRAAADVRRRRPARGHTARPRARDDAGAAAPSHLPPVGARRALRHRAGAGVQLRRPLGDRQDHLRRSHRARAGPPSARGPVCGGRVDVDGRDAEERRRALSRGGRRERGAPVRRGRQHCRPALHRARSGLDARGQRGGQRAAEGARVVSRRRHLRHQSRGELRSRVRAPDPHAGTVRDA